MQGDDRKEFDKNFKTLKEKFNSSYEEKAVMMSSKTCLIFIIIKGITISNNKISISNLEI